MESSTSGEGNVFTCQLHLMLLLSMTIGASNTTGEVISTPLQVTQSGTEQTLKAVGVKPGSGHPVRISIISYGAYLFYLGSFVIKCC